MHPCSTERTAQLHDRHCLLPLLFATGATTPCPSRLVVNGSGRRLHRCHHQKPSLAAHRSPIVGKSISLFTKNHASRSEEHTSELQSLMLLSSAVFCLKTNTPSLNNNSTIPRI